VGDRYNKKEVKDKNRDRDVRKINREGLTEKIRAIK